MKKLISLILCFILTTSSVLAAPESTVAPTETPTAEATAEPTVAPAAEVTAEPTTDKNSTVTVTATIEAMPFIKSSDATLELLSKDGQVIDSKTMPITPDTKSVVFAFNTPAFEIGKDFDVKIIDGIDSIVYYENRFFKNQPFVLPTYTYRDSEGNEKTSTDIAVTIRPLYEKSINVSYNGQNVNIRGGGRLMDEIAMVPLRAVAEAAGFSVRYDPEYRAAVVSIANDNMYFNVGTTYTTVFGNDIQSLYPTTMIDDTIYVPLRTFAEAIGSEITVNDHYTYLDVSLSESSVAKEYFSKLAVNQWGIASRTNYMVWVSLSEYKVRLYEGKQYQWKPLLEATCAIGAPGTPSITGSYEYQYKTRWDYGTYYVGPCLVFYGGYALHSVLLYQNGTEYDGRVGVQISHGCIRLKKKDIDFIANTIPVGTRIYCTR